jgi:hypothetical protein
MQKYNITVAYVMIFKFCVIDELHTIAACQSNPFSRNIDKFAKVGLEFLKIIIINLFYIDLEFTCFHFFYSFIYA